MTAPVPYFAGRETLICGRPESIAQRGKTGVAGALFRTAVLL
jgi:hypothetical protein